MGHPGDMALKVRVTLEPHGPATAIELSDAQVVELAAGKRAPVLVTIGERTTRLRLAVMGGKNLIGLSKAARAELGVDIGDTIDAVIDVDTAERTVDVPEELAQALRKHRLTDRFDALAYTRRKGYAASVSGAKRTETRERRIATVITELSDNR